MVEKTQENEMKNARIERMKESGFDKLFALIEESQQIVRGRLVLDNFEFGDGMYNQELDFCDLSNGLKIVAVISDGIRYTLKVPVTDEKGQAIPDKFTQIAIPEEFNQDLQNALIKRARELSLERATRLKRATSIIKEIIDAKKENVAPAVEIAKHIGKDER